MSKVLKTSLNFNILPPPVQVFALSAFHIFYPVFSRGFTRLLPPIPYLLPTIYLILFFTSSKFAFPSNLTNTPSDFKLINPWKITSEYIYLGNSFNYETGFGRVAVRSDGSKNTATIHFTSNSEFSYTHLKYNVDSYFRDAVVGTDIVTANLFSIKLLFDAAHRTNTALEYKLLNSSHHSSVHFLNFFSGVSLGTVFAAAGLTSYFGKDIDTEFGAFFNLNYPMENKAEFFIEYSTLDFMKIFQNTSIASAAKNIGVFSASNAPKDALSYGFGLFLSDRFSTYFKIYDIEQQMRPTLGVGYKY